MIPFGMMVGPATGRTGQGTAGSEVNGVVPSVLSGYLGTAGVPPGEDFRGMGCLGCQSRRGKQRVRRAGLGLIGSQGPVQEQWEKSLMCVP